MIISEVINNCERYIINNGYKSFDQFDALTNPLINHLTKNNQLLRRISIQVVARSPIDLHFLGMKKMVHTKTISDLLLFYSLNRKIEKSKEINDCFELLIKNKLNEKYIWGLKFPYASRFIDADIFMPNLYNTVNAGLSICHSFAYLTLENQERAKLALNGIVTSLETEFGYIDEIDRGWYIYYPRQKDPVYNVNALTIYLLVYIKKIGLNDITFLNNRIHSLISLLLEEQENNGCWYYSRADNGKWVDGFHTGFIIESLAFAYKEGYKIRLKECLQKGWSFYINNMFTKEGYPRYFLKSKKYPIESQNCAQAIQTLSNISLWINWEEKELLSKVISNTIKNLYDNHGFFYYKKTKIITYKKPFFRWSITPMMLALSYFQQMQHTKILSNDKISLAL
jgi:hypothetical protein